MHDPSRLMRSLSALALSAIIPLQAASSPTPIVRDMRSALAQLSAEDRFSGAALFAERGDVLFQGAYGYADHSFGVKNSVTTKFNIGSMGKMFTGVAILQLAQTGKISLDDRLAKDLPTYPNHAIASEITIRQLLTHTSGLGDFFGPDFARYNMSRYDTLESLLPFFVRKPLLFKPGSSWRYSNAGYIVLGLVVTHVSGESYYKYVQRHIFDVAGMHDTGNWPADEDVPNRAVGYTNMAHGAAAPRTSNVFFLQRGGSAGGGYSTVGDLWRFAQALQGNRLLSAAYTKLDLQGYVRTGRPGVRYGYGMEEKIINGVRIVGHSGGGPGIQGVLDMYPDSGYVVAILTNYENAAFEIASQIRTAVTGGKTVKATAVSPADLKALAGSYEPVVPSTMKLPTGFTPPPIVVSVEKNGLSVNPGLGPAFHFIPVSPTQFVASSDATQRITFVKDAAGRVTRLKTNGFGPVPALSATRNIRTNL